NVAIQFYKQERWDVAARSFRQFLKDNARHAKAPAARLFLGQALVQQSKFNEARDAFREYAKLHADGTDIALARFRVAECSFFLGDDRSAVQETDEFLQRHPGHDLVPLARLYRGQSQLRLNDAAGAEQTLVALIDKNPEPGVLAEAQYALARAQEALGKSAEALALYEQLSAAKDGRFAADSRFRLASIAYAGEDYPRAAELFAAVANDFPTHSLAGAALLNAGYAEYSQGHNPEALAYFAKAAADPEQAAVAGMWTALTQRQAGDLDQAVGTLRGVYEKDENQPLADRLLFNWADTELRRGGYAEARRLFGIVVERWPDGERADDSLNRATEAALRGGDLSDGAQLNDQFEQKYSSSSLRWRQQVLAGRIQLAQGDALRESNRDDPAAADAYRAVVERLSRVVQESEVAATQLAARVHLAEAFDRLADSARVIETLGPVADAVRAGQGTTELTDGVLLEAHVLNRDGRHEEAAALADLCLEHPDITNVPAALGELALAKVQLGDDAAVTATLDRLKAVDSGGLEAAAAAYQCAEAAYAAKRWDLAATCFASAASFDEAAGYKASALSGLGFAHHEAGQHALAAAAFDELLKLPSADRRLLSNAAHMRAVSLQLAGSTEESLAAYNAGLEQFAPRDSAPTSDDEIDTATNAYRCGKGAARLLRELGRIEEADAAYASAYKVLTALPSDRQIELDRFINEWALLSYEGRRFERSDELFALLVEQRPDSDLADEARLYLAESRYFAGEVDEAGAEFAKLADDPRADDFVRHRSSVLLLDIAADRERWDELLQRAERFQQQFPASAQLAYAQYRAGEAALQADNLDRAISELTALAAKTDEKVTQAEWYSSIYVLLAEAQFRKQDYPQVEATVAAFRERFPSSPLLYHADEVLGRSYIKRAKFPDARASLTNVINSESGRRTKTAAKAQFHIAESFLIEKDYKSALPEYYKVYVNYRFPEWQAPALFQAGQCDETLENWREAVQTYETLIKEFPDSEYTARSQQRIQEIGAKGQ
ncbi:MAG: tetratricopeptide repeat protein, partial [Planctomycetaceae bacterium]|nr:tetratricopeptide repeat protein [Planctomycetaceae bacterium]